MNNIKCFELQTPLSAEVLHYVSQSSKLLVAQRGQIPSKTSCITQQHRTLLPSILNILLVLMSQQEM